MTRLERETTNSQKFIRFGQKTRELFSHVFFFKTIFFHVSNGPNRTQLPICHEIRFHCSKKCKIPSIPFDPQRSEILFIGFHLNLSLVHLSACVNAEDEAVVRRRGLTLRSRGPTGGDGRLRKQRGGTTRLSRWLVRLRSDAVTYVKKTSDIVQWIGFSPIKVRFQQTTDTLLCSNKIFCVKLYSLLVAMTNFLRYSCCWTIFLKKINSLTACLDLSKYFEGSKIYSLCLNYKIF